MSADSPLAPQPGWAVKMAADHLWPECSPACVDRLARLLVSVREDTLREMGFGYVPAVGDVICSPDYMKLQYVVTGPLETDPYGNPSVPTWCLSDREENRFYRPSRYAVKLRDATAEERAAAGLPPREVHP